ncbi:MAG: undecaprenyl/decaprenyl-phosphate alpha-N-acetylglucosaminyl 1-phosphate transferase [Phycisphaerae bacterium]|nr:undecaprenyl/decaprenyl-phosphate alpha-N-acetylglucosaminyl 1-phosphate transferase [Phycisphaerae bacterium]
MVWLCLTLIPLALALSLPATWVVRRVSLRLNALDSAGVAGQVKAARRAIPNTGGVAIFWSFAAPMAAGLLAAWAVPTERWESISPALAGHLPGLRAVIPGGLVMLACAGLLHVMGLVDDRRPLGPMLKLGAMAVLAGVAVVATETRVLTMLDAYAGGSWLSVGLTVAWVVAMVNAMNFIDNMDGLSAGVGAIASACFLAVSLIHGQWFVGACFALLIGSLLGFLRFNAPPARIFMGDGGSTVLGFLLAFLSARITFVPTESWTFYTAEAVTQGRESGPLHAALTPLLVLAIPLYDFASVTVIRLSQGKSPFVGDLQHFSHRLADRGLTRPQAVLVIWGASAITGIGGLSLASLSAWQAWLVVGQTLLMLGVIAVFERWTRRTPTP